MNMFTLASFLVLLSALELSSGQDCVRAISDGGDSLPSFFDPERNGPLIAENPIQVIIPSYQFHCCGKVGGWAAFVEPGGGNHNNGVYSVNFQIWRPVGGNGSTSYVKVGENAFPALTLREASRIEQELPNSEQLDFQPGDVVGYYLEDNRNQNGGVQFDTDFNREELWYATGNSALQNECRLEVGSAGNLSLSTSLGPIISISLSIPTVNDNCPSTFTSTMFCSTPIITSTPTPTSTPIPGPVETVVSVLSSSSLISSTLLTNTTVKFFPVPSQIVLKTTLPLQSSNIAVIDHRSHFDSSSVLATPRVATNGSTETNSGNTTLLIAIIVALLVLVALLTLLLIIGAGIVLKKKANESHKGLTLTHINLRAVVKTDSEVATTTQTQPPDRTMVSDLKDHDYHDNVESISSSITKNEAYGYINSRNKNPQVTQNLVYGDTSTVDGTAEPMVHFTQDGSDPTMRTNTAYEELTEPQIREETYDYACNPDSAICDPPTAGNPAYGNITTTAGGDQNYYINEGLGGAAEARMTRNEAYTGVRQSSSNNEPSITTKQNEAYDSFLCNSQIVISDYDYASTF